MNKKNQSSREPHDEQTSLNSFRAGFDTHVEEPEFEASGEIVIDHEAIKAQTELQENVEVMSLFVDEAKNDLLTFAQLMDKNYETTWFHEVIAKAMERTLQNVVEKKKTRIILTIPPRHGKTQLAARLFPAWALGKYPWLRFILSTYGADLSEKSGMATRDVINSERYQTIFPGTMLRRDSKAKAKWMTTEGGEYLAVGVGGPVTGSGADIIILDDPHKSREEAESATMRETVWEYYRSTLYSRLEGAGAVIVIMQRWHDDDLIGRLVAYEEDLAAKGEPHDEWEIINFAAIADEDEPYRKAGEALWPSKFPVDVLLNIRQTQGFYNWASQYQQDPILAETQDFKEEYFKYYEEEILAGLFLRYTTTVDPATAKREKQNAKRGSSLDNTVIRTVGKEINGPRIFLIREDAGRFDPLQTIDLIFQHQATYRSDVYVETVAYQSTLKWFIEEEQRKRQRYFVCNDIKSRTNKEDRIRGLLPLYLAGVIYHRKSDFKLEEELLKFPRGKHDDRADCLAMQLEAMQNTNSNRVKQFKKKFNGYFSRDRQL